MIEMADLKIAKCARCNEIFLQILSQVCEACLDDEEGDYSKIRDVLSRKADVGIEEVAQASGVTISCVLRMLDVGLITNEGVGNPARCGQCGEPAISISQRLCQTCLIALDQRLSQQLAELRLRLRVMNDAEAAQVHETLRAKRRNS